MRGRFFELSDEDERALDEDARDILEGLRRLCSETKGQVSPDQVLAAPEERHLRLRLSRSADDWVNLLVGDGYTEFTRSGEKTYRGYLTPQETIARVGSWMSL
jgi:hypothetical protein